MGYLDGLFGVAGKVAVVTGGSRGIGFAIAAGLARAGARVYVSSRDAAACDEAAAELSEFGHCEAIAANVADEEGRTRLVEAMREREGRVDVLVNNAGAIWAAPLAEYPPSGWDKVYDLNVRGVFFLIQEMLPLLEAASSPGEPSRIVNVGSVNAMRIPEHETYAYVSSKAALHQLSRHLAKRLAGAGVTVNVLAPGLYPSKMQKAEIARRGEADVASPVPLKRLATDDDVAAAVLYLASRAGSYLTGAVIPVDGGMATTI